MDNTDALVTAMSEAVDQGGIPVALIPHAGDAPQGEYYLELLRGMVETTGSATGGITFGTDEASGLVPLTNVDAEEALSLLVQMRQKGLLDPVRWVVLADDTYRTLVMISGEESTATDQVDCLMVLCVVPDGPGWVVMQPYVKDEGGVVHWGDVESHSQSGDYGTVTALMNDLVTA